MIDQHASLSEKFIKKGFWLYLFSFIIAPIGYVIKVILSGELSVSEIGVLYGVISLITLVSAYNDLGVTESLNHFIPQFITEKRYDKVKTILLFSFIAQLLSGFSIACFFFFGAPFIAENYFQSSGATGTLKIFAFFFLGINVFQILSTFFIAIQNTFYNKIIDFFRIIFILISTLIVLYSGNQSLEYFSFSWIVGLYLGTLIALLIFTKKYYFPYLKNEKILYDRKLFFMVFRYSGVVLLGAQAGVVLSQMDMQMIIYLLGTQDAGYYTNYLSIISIPFMIITPIFGLLFPLFSELHSKNEDSKIALIKNTLGNNLINIVIAFNVLFFIFAETIAYILFGEKFINSGTILKYSILLLVFNFLFQINFHILSGIGMVGKRVKIILIGICFNFIMNLLLINYIGVYGAALATGIGWIIIWILSEYFLGKKFSISYNYKTIGKNIVIFSCIGYCLYLYIVPILSNNSRINTLVYFIIITIFYFFIFTIINIKQTKEFLLQIRKIKRVK